MRQSRIKELERKVSLTKKEQKQLKKYKELEKLNPDEVEKLYQQSKQSMTNKLNKDYYTSPKLQWIQQKLPYHLVGKQQLNKL